MSSKSLALRREEVPKNRKRGCYPTTRRRENKTSGRIEADRYKLNTVVLTFAKGDTLVLSFSKCDTLAFTFAKWKTLVFKAPLFFSGSETPS